MDASYWNSRDRIVHSIVLGEYNPLSFDPKQSAEIWITAAQSFFALSLLVNFEISTREAVGLLFLFISQVLIEFAIIRDIIQIPLTSHSVLLVYTAVYVLLGGLVMVKRRSALVDLIRRSRVKTSEALLGQS